MSGIPNLENTLKATEVTLIHPNEVEIQKLYLIYSKTKGFLLEDLKKTYPINEFQLNIAKELFKNSESEQTYGILLDKNLKVYLVFNTHFAEYNKNSCEVKFKDIEKVFLEQIKKIEKSES